jgi:hypothetical protein
MWVQIRTSAVAWTLLAGTSAVACAQGMMTQAPSTTRNMPDDQPSLGISSPAAGGYGALGAGASAAGNWTGTNPGIDGRSPGVFYFRSGLR